MANIPSKELSKLNHIDLLRGIAVILVVITHVALTDRNITEVWRARLIFGQVGVQLFFFLSAYTLCRSMSARREEHYVRNFYLRRFFRIAPLYYAGIVIYLIVALTPLLNRQGPLSHIEMYTPLSVLLNIVFLHSFVEQAYNSIVPGGWSIGTEMLFYLLFPAIFNYYSKIRNVVWLFLLPLAAFIIATLYTATCYAAFKEEVFTNHFFFAFIINQLPIFALGISYFFLEKFIPTKLPPLVSMALFLVLFFAALILSRKLTHNINLTIFVAGLSFAFLFNFFKHAGLNLPILARIGQLSFSIYIFHFLFAYPLSNEISIHISGRFNATTVLVINFLITLTLSALLAILSEKFIEKPGIALGKKVIGRLDNK
ncbi:acyltransferase family protein [Mucilaginibacter pedocola]|uniref:Acyltransferase 3 domain-containing protein n=1 Tax=Mucilaginibacter pedocola TaxID=1792845 RepID=A0A1S9P8K2_9SPHI|nr:acyltransferase [Mucilaginibacter pedocola]OOQ57291.1 hypothetical protein BC343_14340 [Mucilaginibacter pedocola]